MQGGYRLHTDGAWLGELIQNAPWWCINGRGWCSLHWRCACRSLPVCVAPVSGVAGMLAPALSLVMLRLSPDCRICRAEIRVFAEFWGRWAENDGLSVQGFPFFCKQAGQLARFMLVDGQ